MNIFTSLLLGNTLTKTIPTLACETNAKEYSNSTRTHSQMHLTMNKEQTTGTSSCEKKLLPVRGD